MAAEASNEALWRAMLTGEIEALRRDRQRLRRIPGSPRCKACNLPLGGIAAPFLRLRGRGPSNKNPRYCNLCDSFVQSHPGGAEVELTLLFADVRGSTALAEGMRPTEFRRLLNRFYSVSNRVIIDSDGFVDRLVGDEVVSFYLPFLGPEHPGVAVRAARDLLLAVPEVERGRKLPVGVGVHTGVAFVGSVGFEDSEGDEERVRDFTALGDAVNVTARLASLAGPGEAIISEAVFASGADLSDFADLERRHLEVKGRSESLDVRVLRVGATTGAAGS
ncbi:MAG: adenylate/guanylate cyclase domain-containing protein [Nitriliruptorales bacterium]